MSAAQKEPVQRMVRANKASNPSGRKKVAAIRIIVRMFFLNVSLNVII
jgi:hypothetical protein